MRCDAGTRVPRLVGHGLTSSTALVWHGLWHTLRVLAQVDFVLLGGDLFHDNMPSQRTIARCGCPHALHHVLACMA